jgi:CheY-like chemotaxis protein
MAAILPQFRQAGKLTPGVPAVKIQPMPGEKKVVLLVEDSEIVREMTKLALMEAGYEVRTAVGNLDLEKQINENPGFLTSLDLIVLDMELEEVHQSQREDKQGSHKGVYMTGSQLGATLAFAHPQLKTVPFLIYSGKEPDEIRAHLDELKEFAQLDDQIKDNFKGFVPKQAGGEEALVEKIREILSA